MLIHRRRQVRHRVDQGAVQIEHHQARQAAVEQLAPAAVIDAHLRQLRAHGVDHRLVVGLVEDRRTGDEGVGAGRGDLADVVRR